MFSPRWCWSTSPARDQTGVAKVLGFMRSRAKEGFESSPMPRKRSPIISRSVAAEEQ